MQPTCKRVRLCHHLELSTKPQSVSDRREPWPSVNYFCLNTSKHRRLILSLGNLLESWIPRKSILFFCVLFGSGTTEIAHILVQQMVKYFKTDNISLFSCVLYKHAHAFSGT